MIEIYDKSLCKNRGKKHPPPKCKASNGAMPINLGCGGWGTEELTLTQKQQKSMSHLKDLGKGLNLRWL